MFNYDDKLKIFSTWDKVYRHFAVERNNIKHYSTIDNTEQNEMSRRFSNAIEGKFSRLSDIDMLSFRSVTDFADYINSDKEYKGFSATLIPNEIIEIRATKSNASRPFWATEKGRLLLALLNNWDVRKSKLLLDMNQFINVLASVPDLGITDRLAEIIIQTQEFGSRVVGNGIQEDDEYFVVAKEYLRDVGIRNEHSIESILEDYGELYCAMFSNVQRANLFLENASEAETCFRQSRAYYSDIVDYDGLINRIKSHIALIDILEDEPFRSINGLNRLSYLSFSDRQEARSKLIIVLSAAMLINRIARNRFADNQEYQIPRHYYDLLNDFGIAEGFEHLNTTHMKTDNFIDLKENIIRYFSIDNEESREDRLLKSFESIEESVFAGERRHHYCCISDQYMNRRMSEVFPWPLRSEMFDDVCDWKIKVFVESRLQYAAFMRYAMFFGMRNTDCHKLSFIKEIDGEEQTPYYLTRLSGLGIAEQSSGNTGVISNNHDDDIVRDNIPGNNDNGRDVSYDELKMFGICPKKYLYYYNIAENCSYVDGFQIQFLPRYIATEWLHYEVFDSNGDNNDNVNVENYISAYRKARELFSATGNNLFWKIFPQFSRIVKNDAAKYIDDYIASQIRVNPNVEQFLRFGGVGDNENQIRTAFGRFRNNTPGLNALYLNLNSQMNLNRNIEGHRLRAFQLVNKPEEYSHWLNEMNIVHRTRGYCDAEINVSDLTKTSINCQYCFFQAICLKSYEHQIDANDN